jgi:hypothetical protein
MNGHYQRRFGDPNARFLSNERTLSRFDEPTRDRIKDLLVTLDSWDVVAEAERTAKAEGERRERMRRWETSGQIQGGDPGQ